MQSAPIWFCTANSVPFLCSSNSNWSKIIVLAFSERSENPCTLDNTCAFALPKETVGRVRVVLVEMLINNDTEDDDCVGWEMLTNDDTEDDNN